MDDECQSLVDKLSRQPVVGGNVSLSWKTVEEVVDCLTALAARLAEAEAACHACDHYWAHPSERASDVALSVLATWRDARRETP